MTRPWKRVITGVAEAMDKLDDHETNFVEVRNEVAGAFKADVAYDEYGGDDFSDAVFDLANAETRADFDAALEAIYDWADDERVWISPVAADHVWVEEIEDEPIEEER